MGNTLAEEDEVEGWIAGIIATALAGIAMGIFMKITWKGWDELVHWIMMTFGVGSEIKYAPGIVLFILACMLGLIQLKKFKKKLPFLALPHIYRVRSPSLSASLTSPSSSRLTPTLRVYLSGKLDTRNPTIHACYILKQSKIVNVYIIPPLFEKYKIEKRG